MRNKGARVSQRLSLAGRYLVLISHSENIGVSKRIENKEERDRLRHIVERLRPLDYGIIVRTEAVKIPESQIQADIEELLERFKEILGFEGVTAPRTLYREMGIMGRFVRDRLSDDVSTVLIDDYEEFVALQKLTLRIAPKYYDRIKYYGENTPILRRYNLEDDIAAAQKRVVPLPSGGHLVIDENEALTAIDVNTGRFIGKNRFAETILVANLEAVVEASRQLRLRNIGGIIVIDLIDMDNTRDRVKVMNTLENALKLDKARTRIVQLSPLGLIEMTRRREGESIRQALYTPCSYCHGDGVIKLPLSIAIEVRKRLHENLINLSSKKNDADAKALDCYITVHPDAALAIVENQIDEIRRLEALFAASVHLKAHTEFHAETVEIGIIPRTNGTEASGHFEEKTYVISWNRVSMYSHTVIIIDNIIVFTEDSKNIVAGHDTTVRFLEVNSLYARARVLAGGS